MGIESSPAAGFAVDSGQSPAPLRVTVTCLLPNRLIDKTVCQVGDEVTIPVAVARRLYSEGAVSVADVGALGTPAPNAPPVQLPVGPAVNPFAAMPQVEVVAQRTGVYQSSVYTNGQTVTMGEQPAVDWIATGAAVLAPGASLSARGQAYLAAKQSGDFRDVAASY
jgi:hypothetical protein